MKSAYFLTMVCLLNLPVQADEIQLDPLPEPIAAPDFNQPDQSGQKHTLADYQDKVLVVNFWATWCPPCIREMPSLDRLQQQLKDQGLEVIGVNMGETPERIATFTDRIKVGFPLLYDEDMTMTMNWEVQHLPTTFIVNRAGEIIYAVVGDKPWDDPAIAEQIQALLSH